MRLCTRRRWPYIVMVLYSQGRVLYGCGLSTVIGPIWKRPYIAMALYCYDSIQLWSYLVMALYRYGPTE